MKKRILSLALVCVMLLTAIPVFAISVFADDAKNGYTTSWMDNLPSVNDSTGAVTYKSGKWTIGNKSTTDANSFTLFAHRVAGSGMISTGNGDQWGLGAIYMNGFDSKKNVAVVPSNYNVSYRYIAEYSGNVTLSVDSLVMLSGGSGIATTGDINSAFAIAVDGVVVWPEGATYGDKTTWFNAEAVGTDVASKIPDYKTTVNKGVAIEFLFGRIGGGSWSHYNFAPSVTFEDTGALPADGYTTAWQDAYPLINRNTPTILYPNASWAIGYKTLGTNDFYVFNSIFMDSNKDLIRHGDHDQWSRGGLFYDSKNGQKAVLVVGGTAYASSYRYVAEYTGKATLSLDNLVFLNTANAEGTSNAAFSISVNGKSVWPEGASETDISTWYYAADKAGTNVADEIGNINVSLAEGDVVEFLFGRVKGGWGAADFRPVVTYSDIEEKYLVRYLDENDAILADYVLNPGDTFPVYPENAIWDMDGDGAADELPATVTHSAELRLVARATQSATSVNPSNVGGKLVAHSYTGWDTVFLKTNRTSETGTELPTKDIRRYIPNALSTSGGFTWAYCNDLNTGFEPANQAGFIVSGSTDWKPNGSAIASWGYNVGWRFTATYTGVADVTVDYLKNNGKWASAATNSYFAILKNGEKIWPTDANWYLFNTLDENMAETIMASAASVLTGMMLNKGDTLEFLTTDAGGSWSNQFNGLFTVTYREAPAAAATVKDASVALGEQFAAVYSVDAPADATNVGVNVNGKFYAADENGKVALPAVAAKNIVDEQTATTTYTDAAGNVWYGESYTYSVADLLMQYVNGADEKAANLAIATLNYAAAAQEFFGYNTFDLANADLSDEQKTVADGSCDDGHIIDKEEVENEIATFWGVKLILGDTVNMAVYFKSDVDLTTGYTAVCARYPDFDEDASVQFRKTETAIEEVSEGLYKVIFTGFMPSAWNGNFHFYLTDGEDTKVTDGLHYDVLDYLARADEAEMAEIVDAMLALYEAAKAYNA